MPAPARQPVPSPDGPGAAIPPAPAWREAALLAAVTIAVFSPTLAAGFVYDARMQILTDPFIHDPSNWPDVLGLRVLARDVLDFNRPVNLASLMIDAAIWGKAPFGYHLTSVLLHAANVVLAWAVMRSMTLAGRGQSPPRLCPGRKTSGFRGSCDSGIASMRSRRLFVHSLLGDDGVAPGIVGRLPRVLAPLLFAVHPLVTEAVCEPTFREDLLVALFTLVGLLLAMGHDPRRPGIDAWRAAACAGCSLLAIGAKESGIAAPCVVAAYWLLFRRGEPGGFWALAAGGAKVVVLCFLAARFLLEPSPSKIFEGRPQYPGGSFAAAMAIEPRILALYAQLVLLPINLCADYGLHSVRHLPLPLAVAILAAVVAMGVLAARADRRQALAAVLIVVPLVPVANLVPIYRAAADRYLYLPLAGVALAVGWLFDGPWLARRRQVRDAACVGLLAAVALLGMACAERQGIWRSSLALWEDTHRRNPLSHDAAAGFADALREAGRLPEAESASREAIRLAGGGVADDWATLALVLDGLGRETEAKQALSRAFELDRRLADPLDRVEARAMERPVAEELIRLRDKLFRNGEKTRLER